MRSPICAAALTLVCAASATAEPPKIAKVAGVASGDTLTIRAEPRASSRAVGALKNGDAPLEILETVRNGDTEWARISFSEGESWAARRFLEEIQLSPIGATSLTVGLICGGTEPFWSVQLTGDKAATWNAPSTGSPRDVAIDAAIGAEARGGWPAAVQLSDGEFKAVLTASPTECSDGMSDRHYPWRALLLDLSAEKPRLFEGCCGHQPNRSR